MRSAYSLLELVVVIALVGILISLVAPSLGEIRHQAQRTAAASNMRQHGTQFAAYVLDYDDLYPLYLDPSVPYSTVYFHGEPIAEQVPYFSMRKLWSVAVADYYRGRYDDPVFQSPARRGSNDLVCAAFYSCSFCAGPEYWAYRTRTGPEQWRAVRASELKYSSQKAVLIEWGWDRRLGLESRTLPGLVGVADGAVVSIPVGDLLDGYIGGEGNFPGSFYGFAVPGMMTIDGVRGRDTP